MEFNHDLLKQDVADVGNFIVNFFRSFGPSQKKFGEKPVGFFEELHIRFRLWLVELGPVTIFKTIIVIASIIILYTLIIRRADFFITLVVIVGLAFLYNWVWGVEFEKAEGPIDTLISGIQWAVMELFSAFKKPEEKKK